MFEGKSDILLPWGFMALLIFEKCYGNYDCHASWSGRNICFLFNETFTTFEESEQFCQDNGGFLLEIRDEELQRHLEKYDKNRTGSPYWEAWLNLVFTNTSVQKNKWVWAWGGVPGNRLTYSNWDNVSPYRNGVNKAILISGYKWSNAYDPQTGTTFCIQGNRETFFKNTLNIRMAIGVGVGVGLGALVLIIVSSLLVAKFVCHREIPCSYKSSRNKQSSSSSSSPSSSPHQTGSGVINASFVNNIYGQNDESKFSAQDSNSETTHVKGATVEASDDSQPTSGSYYNINNINNYNNNDNNNLDHVQVDYPNQSNFNQEPERIATPDGTLSSKAF